MTAQHFQYLSVLLQDFVLQCKITVRAWGDSVRASAGQASCGSSICPGILGKNQRRLKGRRINDGIQRWHRKVVSNASLLQPEALGLDH